MTWTGRDEWPFFRMGDRHHKTAGLVLPVSCICSFIDLIKKPKKWSPFFPPFCTVFFFCWACQSENGLTYS